MIVDADAQVQFNGPIGILVSYSSGETMSAVWRLGMRFLARFSMLTGEHPPSGSSVRTCKSALLRTNASRRQQSGSCYLA